MNRPDVIIVDEVMPILPAPVFDEPLAVRIPLRHQYRPAPDPNGMTCRICKVHFDNHWHTETFLQRVIAKSAGKEWSRCTFRQRQDFKTKARWWFGEQVKRILKAQSKPKEKADSNCSIAAPDDGKGVLPTPYPSVEIHKVLVETNEIPV